jgi:hypothetical protein
MRGTIRERPGFLQNCGLRRPVIGFNIFLFILFRYHYFVIEVFCRSCGAVVAAQPLENSEDILSIYEYIFPILGRRRKVYSKQAMRWTV